MVEPGTSNTERHFPTFHRLWRILCIMVRLKVTRYLLLPLVLLYAGVWGVLRYNDHILTKKYNQAEADLEQLSTQVGQYKDKTGQYPRSMDDLVRSGIVQTPPIDPFSKNKEPYRIINLNNGAMVRVYSVGEDGEDNHSIKDYTVVAHEEVYYGEKGMGLYETLQIEWTKDDPDNGMSYFMRGMLASEIDTRDPYGDIAALVGIFGWNDAFNTLNMAHDYVLQNKISPSRLIPIPGIPVQYSEIRYSESMPKEADILDLFTANETSFNLVREGTERPYTKAVIYEDDLWYGTPLPTFLRAQNLSRTLIAHGKWLEVQGSPEEAVDDYLTAVRLGQAQGETRTLTGMMVGIAIESTAYRALIESVSNSDLGPDYLAELMTRLEDLERTRPTLLDSFLFEHISFKNHPEEMGLLNRKSKRNNELFWNHMRAYVEKPYPVAYNEDPMAIVDQMDFLNRIAPNVPNANVRDINSRSYSVAARIVLGLRHYHALHGAYPDSLDAIADLYEGKTPPVDPFTTKAFVYEKTGDSFLLYSPGPELVDDKAAILYDPTNGTVSVGDIVYGK